MIAFAYNLSQKVDIYLIFSMSTFHYVSSLKNQQYIIFFGIINGWGNIHIQSQYKYKLNIK